jgi:plasmid stabilization system protein ParE
MKVLLSERVEAAFERHLSFGVERFGKSVAERTFNRARRYLLDVLTAYPRIGVYRERRDVYEIVIPRTPFVAFYRIDAADEVRCSIMPKTATPSGATGHRNGNAAPA